MLKQLHSTTLRTCIGFLDRMLVIAALIGLAPLAEAQTVSQYTFAQSTGTYTTITGGTVLFSTTFDDNTPATVTIPSFDFAGTYYTTMYVSTNGFLTFGSAPATTEYNPISTTATFTGAVSAFGADLNNAASGTREIRWQQVGSEVIVQWRAVRRNGLSGETIDFQIHLNTSTGAITTIYANSTPNASTSNYPQVGLRGPNNTFATNVNNRRVDQTFPAAGSTWATSLAGTTNADECRYNTTSGRNPGDGQSYVWTPPCLPPTVASAGGDQSICTTTGHATLAANTPTIGTGAWSVTSGPSTLTSQFSSVSSPTATFTPAGGAGTYNLLWTISNSPCTASTDAMVLTVSAPPSTAVAGSNQNICTSSGSATMNATAPVTGTGAWSFVSGPATPTITTPSSRTTTVTGMTTPGAYVLQWTVSNGACTASTSQMTVTAGPTIAAAGSDQTICSTTSSVTLAANTPTVGTGAWSIISGPSTLTSQFSSLSNATATFTPAGGAGTYQLKWTITFNACATSTDIINVIVNAPPTTANAGSPQTICATSGTATMAGNTATTGTGTWTFVSGPVTPTITTPSSATTGITGMTAAGNYVFQWTITNAPCTASSSQVTITATAAPTTASAGSTQTICTTSGSATMAANTPGVGTGAWSFVSGPSTPTITTASSPTTTITGMSTAGSYVFKWTISNAPCAASTSNVTITVNAPPTTANAGSTQTICATSGTVTMAGNTATTGSGAWSFISGPVTPTITTPSSATTGISGMTTAGNYVFQWTITNAPCTASSSQVTITATAAPTTASAGSTQTICTTTSSVTLAANTPSVGTGAWSIVSGPSLLTSQFSSLTSPTATFTPAGGAGTYNLKWTISNAPCTASTATVNIVVNAPPTTAAAGSPQTICATSGSATMAGNTATTGTGAWSFISGPVTPTITTPSSATSGITGMTTAGNYVFQWTISNAPCTASSSQVSITATGAPTTAAAGSPQTICTTSGSATMAANTASVGTGSWSQVSGPLTATITNAASPTTTITGMTTAGSYVFKWSISNSPCTTSTSNVTITVNAPPTTANAGSTQTICATSGTATMAGNTATTGTGTWSFISGPVTPTITTPSSATTGITGMTTAGNYVFQWTITNAPCTASSSQVTITAIPGTTTAIAGSDQTICANGTATLAANTPTNGTGAWSVTSGPSTLASQFSSASSPTAIFTPAGGAGTYNLQWAISNSPCATSTDAMVITVNPIPTAPIMAPTSATICLGGSTGLSASSPNITTSSANGGTITITDFFVNSTSPYPGTISVSGLPTSGVTVANVKLNGVSHNAPQDIDLLLRSPLGTNVVLMSDVGSSSAINNLNYVIQDGAAAFSASATNASGTYAPTNSGATDNYPSPGPGSITQATPTLSSFSGNPNGTWSLYLVDDNTNFLAGSISSWSITFSVPVNYAWTPTTGLSASNVASVTASPTSATTYMATVTNPLNSCSNSNTVAVSANTPPNAGTNGSTTVCSNGSAFVLNGSLGGSPNAGGSWTFGGNAHSATFTPGTDAAGVYTYTVNGTAPCANASATVTVNVNSAVSAGSNGSITLCSNGSAINLFSSLGGSPNAGGSWTFGGNAHSATFTPGTDVAGVYTYTVNGTAPCANASATVTVNITTATVWFQDADNDGAGDPDVSITSCTQPNGYVANSNDECPIDPNKISAGTCGCGVPDTDSDSDGYADCVDGCPNDPNKIAPGVCGCGVADTDSDNDGTADCNDGCPNDPNKIAPGVCGCGVADTDSDNDGTADCNDGCPNDPNKIAPGVCGCGVADTDTDNDGTADCNDLCPNDPNKIAPGVCGCGVADTDTDNDGTADCNDLCPNDPNKIAPGVCGCGVADTDTDNDGTADCNDGCPNDPNKIAPGVCGCGVADTDSDNDGTADCNDGCPNDPNKIAPGVCGCGVADTDSDNDGTADCNDGCPNDPNKIAPGVCGCGVADTDSDNDGTADCNDGCPNDPNKIAPGVCGCGVADTDSDNDGTADCNDGCPNDPNKIAPGVCGCGVADTDSDNDGTADCNDGCPNDPNKIAPGVCGCGVADTDTDNDGTADCNDGCPNDPNKIAPGVCGCGVADTDSDNDGTADCNDGCPNDPNKIAPGVCGCGVADTDSDNDGTADCNDLCPNDPNKIAPGVCGCGVADTDSDGDGVPNCIDNCPNVAGQIGSACDDGNPLTTNDVLNASCVCTGTSAANTVQLQLTTDNDAAQTSWEIIPLGGGAALCNGSGYTNSTTYTLNCNLPDGDYRLRVLDSYGDGMCCINGTGGYVFKTYDGRRIIDNDGNGIFATESSVSLGFHLPMGTDHLTASRCDRENYLPSDFIQAQPNPAVQAQYGVGNQTDDGYQFWIFNPNGGYTRRVLLTHANAYYVFPMGPDRCSYLDLSTLTTNPLPFNVLLNVRVRSMVNGVYSQFGPACRFKIDLTNQCPTTSLIDNVNDPHNSCGLTGVMLNGSSTLYCTPVGAANKYQWEFSNANYLRKISTAGSGLNLTQWATLPLQYGGVSYSVRVRVSFDNGANYCPFSASCVITTAAPHGADTREELTVNHSDGMNVWPNPDHNEALHIVIEGFDDATTPIRVSVLDVYGKEVYANNTTVEGETFNMALDLSNSVAPGVYLVNVTANDHTWTKRLVVQ